MLSNRKTNSCPSVIKFLDENRSTIFSRTGGWFPGRGVYSHGHSMLDDLVGKKTYFQILILNATGKLVEKPFADWVEAIYGCLSWPDPRIWCNQIGALAGNAKTTVIAATAMGCLATDSRTYGVLPLVEGVLFITASLKKNELGASAKTIVEEITSKNKGKPYIVGYKRPIAKGDERLEVMEEISKELGFQEGPHLKLAYEIEEVLLKDYNEGMNINGYMSAFLSDQKFTETEVYNMFAMLVASGVTACYLDTFHRPANSFLPLQCGDIAYTGSPIRETPDRL